MKMLKIVLGTVCIVSDYRKDLKLWQSSLRIYLAGIPIPPRSYERSSERSVRAILPQPLPCHPGRGEEYFVHVHLPRDLSSRSERVIDLTDPKQCEDLGIEPDDLLEDNHAIPQSVAKRLRRKGVQAILVPLLGTMPAKTWCCFSRISTRRKSGKSAKPS